jgi:hypothetical protein
MLHFKRPLRAVPTLDDNVPPGRRRVLGSAHNGGGRPDIEFEGFSVVFQPFGELRSAESGTCGLSETTYL